MRFLHTADWQLGKPFGRFEPEVRAALGEARFDAIDRIACADGPISAECRRNEADEKCDAGSI